VFASRTSYRAAVAALVAVSMAALASCAAPRLAHSGGTADGVSPAHKVITIGSTAAKTGPLSAFYEASLGAQAMVQQVNAHGGVNGWKLHYIVLDDSYQAQRAVVDVHQLIGSDHVFSLVSMFGTPSNVATLPYAVAKGVPDIGMAMETGVLAKNYPHATGVFGYIPPYADLAAFLTSYGARTLRARSVSVAYQDDPSGAAALRGASYQARRMRVKLGATVPVPDTATDFSGYAGRLAAAHAPSVVLWMPPALAVGLIKACAVAGYRPHWLAPFFDPVASLYSALGPLTSHVYFESWLPPATSGQAGMKNFLSAIASRFNDRNPSINAELGWIGMGIFIHALSAATAGGNAPTRQALIAALDNGMPFHPGGLPLTLRYSKTSRLPAPADDEILQYRSGHLVRVSAPAKDPSLPPSVLG
jgi:branched-chain amino acid transport system substrate-binding protein